MQLSHSLKSSILHSAMTLMTYGRIQATVRTGMQPLPEPSPEVEGSAPWQAFEFDSLTGTDASLEAAAIECFGKRLRGQFVLPDDGGYEAARRVWNGMVDRKPAIIVRCAAADRRRRSRPLRSRPRPAVSVRCGGHNVAGSSVCDGGLMIDLSGMKGGPGRP